MLGSYGRVSRKERVCIASELSRLSACYPHHPSHAGREYTTQLTVDRTLYSRSLEFILHNKNFMQLPIFLNPQSLTINIPPFDSMSLTTLDSS